MINIAKMLSKPNMMGHTSHFLKPAVVGNYNQRLKLYSTAPVEAHGEPYSKELAVQPIEVLAETPFNYDTLANNLSIVSQNCMENAGAANTIFIGVLIPWVAHAVTKKNLINNQTSELNSSILKSERFIQGMLRSHFDAYSFIEKSDRISASTVKTQSTDVQFLKKELEFQYDRFSELKKLRYMVYTPGYTRKINEQQARIVEEISRLESYRHISEAMFHSEINNYEFALDSMFQALQCYTNTIETSLLSEFDGNVQSLKSKLLTIPKTIGSADFKRLVTQTNIDLAAFNHCLSKLYRAKHKEWFSHILNYLGYIIFDNLGLSPEILTKSNYQCLFTVVFFLNLSVVVNPENTLANNNLGFAYGHLGDLRQSEYFIQKSIETNRIYALSQYNLAQVLEAQGDTEASLRRLEISAKLLNPKYPSNVETGTSDANKDFYKTILDCIGHNKRGENRSIFKKEKLFTATQDRMCSTIIRKFTRSTRENMSQYQQCKLRLFGSHSKSSFDYIPDRIEKQIPTRFGVN